MTIRLLRRGAATCLLLGAATAWRALPAQTPATPPAAVEDSLRSAGSQPMAPRIISKRRAAPPSP